MESSSLKLFLYVICSLMLIQSTTAQNFFISSIDEDGIIFPVTENGVYHITFIDGAYQNAPYWTQPQRPDVWGYCTLLYFYVNRSIEYELFIPADHGLNGDPCYNPTNPDYILGNGIKYPSIESAAEPLIGAFIDIPLYSDQYLRVLCVDSLGNYWENDGGITVDITKKYIITANVSPNGNITPNGDIDVLFGQDQTFTITPDEGYIIHDVLVDGISQGPISSYTFTNIVEDHTIEAVFAEIPHII